MDGRPTGVRMTLLGAAGALALAITAAAPAAPHRVEAAALTPQQRTMQAVVQAWSDRLDAGDYAGLARLFSLPVILVQGPYAYRLTTRHQLVVWHSGLPCSGKVLSITYRGRYATAVFRLGNRRGATCDAPGGLAAARFEIVNGKIRSWIQVPVPKRAGGTLPVA